MQPVYKIPHTGGESDTPLMAPIDGETRKRVVCLNCDFKILEFIKGISSVISSTQTLGDFTMVPGTRMYYLYCNIICRLTCSFV